MYDTFKNKLEEKLNEWFPKGKSKERGAALMLFAFAVELYETLRGKDMADQSANENTPDAEDRRRSFGDPDDDISEDDTEPWRYIREMIINFFLDIDDELPDDLLQANASLLVSRIKSGFIAKRDLLRLLRKKEIEYGKRQIIDDLFEAVKMAHD